MISECKASFTDIISATITEMSLIDALIQPLLKEALAGKKPKWLSRLLDQNNIGNTSLHSERTSFLLQNHTGSCAKRWFDCIENEVICEKTYYVHSNAHAVGGDVHV